LQRGDQKERSRASDETPRMRRGNFSMDAAFSEALSLAFLRALASDQRLLGKMA
jgi:hypothetical protein